MKNFKKISALFTLALFMVAANCFGQSIPIVTVQTTTVCPCSSHTLYYQSAGVTFNAGNAFLTELSDSSGSFAASIAVDTLFSTNDSGLINFFIPCNLPAGTHYRVRVTSSNPVVSGTSTVDLSSGPVTYPTLSMAASTTSTCAGQPITFSVSSSGGGSAPSFSWEVNDNGYIYQIAGATDSIYTTDTLSPGADTVFCVMVSTSACAVQEASAYVAVFVNATQAPGISIAASPGNVVCPGATVTFTATVSGGGTSPSYQWSVNGTNAGTNSPTFTTTSLANNDEVSCVLTSNNLCGGNGNATSNVITMVVTSGITASVDITASRTTVCTDSLVLFSANGVNGGSSPDFEWYINGTAATSTSTNPYVNSFNNGDVVTCIMTSSESCVLGSPATSNAITLTVSNPGGAGTITASQDTVCAGSNVTLTVAGSAGNLQWQQQSDSLGLFFQNISGATTASFTTTLYRTTNYRVVAGVGSCEATSAPVTVVAIPGINYAQISGDETVCAGLTLNYTITNIQNAHSYSWIVPSGWVINSGQGTATINVTAPSVVDSGFIRFIANNACGIDSTILYVKSVTSVVPKITISSDSAYTDTVYACNGGGLYFFANVINGGSAPQYQWKQNGVNVGDQSYFYTSSFVTGDVITCTLTSSFSCASPQVVTSNAVVVKIFTGVPALDSIYGNTNVTAGSKQTYYITHPSPGATYNFSIWNGGYTLISSTDTSITIFVYSDIMVSVYATDHCSSVSKQLYINIGPCSAYFTLQPSRDSTQAHTWDAVNYASGTGPINYTWSWGDGTSSTGATPTHAYAAAGTYTICLSITDSVGCASNYCDSSAYVYRTDGTPITIHVTLPNGTTTGVEKLPVPNSVTIFPNPTEGDVTISTNGNESIKQIIITNTLGQVISTTTISSGNNKTFQVQLPNASGLYFIRMKGEMGEYVNKVVKE